MAIIGGSNKSFIELRLEKVRDIRYRMLQAASELHEMEILELKEEYDDFPFKAGEKAMQLAEELEEYAKYLEELNKKFMEYENIKVVYGPPVDVRS